MIFHVRKLAGVFFLYLSWLIFDVRHCVGENLRTPTCIITTYSPPGKAENVRFFLLYRAGVFVYFHLELLSMFVSVLFSSSATHVVQSQYVFRFCFVFHIDQCFFKPPFCPYLRIPLFCTYFRTQFHCSKVCFFVGGGVRGPGGEPWLWFYKKKSWKI